MLGMRISTINQNQLRSYAQLMKSAGSDLYLDARKANGISKGINSPLVNPWVDLTKNGNNATFQNLAGTTSDGWVNVLLPNGKTMPFLKLDGVDTVGIVPNNTSVDIVGLDEFEIDMLILTPNILQTNFICFKGLDGAISTSQFSVFMRDTGTLEFYIGGSSYVLATAGNIVANTIYNIKIFRASSRLKCIINEIQKYDNANAISVTTQPNFRFGARTSNAGGTTHVGYSNLYIGALSIAKNPDFTKLSSAWSKVVKDYI